MYFNFTSGILLLFRKYVPYIKNTHPSPAWKYVLSVSLFSLSSLSFFLSHWHFLWWVLRKNSYCCSCQFCFVSLVCWALLCHFQGLFQSREHSWHFNQELKPWRNWQLIPNQLCGRYIIYFTVHSGIPFSFHHWERLHHSWALFYKNINNVPFS